MTTSHGDLNIKQPIPLTVRLLYVVVPQLPTRGSHRARNHPSLKIDARKSKQTHDLKGQSQCWTLAYEPVTMLDTGWVYIYILIHVYRE